MNTAGLSLEQAPPISIPFRFFLTATLFGIGASLLALYFGPELFITRWAPLTVGITHTLTLGVIAMVMCGAMTQLLPVLAGTPIPGVQLVGPIVHLMMTLGIVLFVFGFIRSEPAILQWGVGALVLALSSFIGAVGIALARVKSPNKTIVAMRLAVIALMVTMLLGAARGSGFFEQLGFGFWVTLIDVHLGWGLLGWVGLLAMGVSYQVVPMFMVTPEYPARASRWLLPVIFLALIAWSLFKVAGALGYLPSYVATLWFALIGVGFIFFALVTLKIQGQRKRKVPDVSMMFWRVSMVALIFAVGLWLIGKFWTTVGQDPRNALILGVTMIIGVAGALVNGMLYKIVPFLSWFHLQNMQMKLMCFTVQIPNMKQFVTDTSARRQYYLFLWAFLACLLAGLKPDWFARPAALLLGVSYSLLFLNLSKAMLKYRATYRQLLVAAKDQDT